MISHRQSGSTKCPLLVLMLVLSWFDCSRLTTVECHTGELETAAQPDGAAGDLDASASELNSMITSESHKVIASGWPSTSPMWPTIDIDGDDSAGAGAEAESHWFRMIEPFIYADKPRTGDYSLLLKINSTTLELLRAHLSKPLSMSLSFEYYFNHDPKSTALPLIKIEINRKEFKYLDPNGANVKSRRWMKFNERLQIADLQQLEKHDWLKISLVNRDEPSIVAIRRLRAAFHLASSDPVTVDTRGAASPGTADSRPPEQGLAPAPTQPLPPSPTNNNIRPQAPSIVPNEPSSFEQPTRGSTADTAGYDNEVSDGPQQPGEPASQAPQAPEVVPSGGEFSQSTQQASYPQQQTTRGGTGTSQRDIQQAASERISTSVKPPTKLDPITSASEVLSSTIKPVAPPKKKGTWGWPGKRRRRRDTSGSGAGANSATNLTEIALTCPRSDHCEWQSDMKGEGIQWSLARMPSSTSTVQAGYYYVSNRNNYGDARKLLRISLNQTERATIADQNSDHCIDLAIYVTERTYLRMYRLSRHEDGDKDEDSSWRKGNLLMSWAPTLAINDSSIQRRVSLPGSHLAAMEPKQNGWTMETICFGDFFVDPRECGAGKCAFGFLMDTDPAANEPTSSPTMAGDKFSGLREPDSLATSNEDSVGVTEQVVGVSILKEFSQNVRIKPSRSEWLATWQRDEVKPDDGWRFFPKSDCLINNDNISLANLFDDAHYYIESDWLPVSEHLDLTGTLLLEDTGMRNWTGSEMDRIQQHQQNEIGNLFTLKIKSKLVDSNFNSIFVNETQSTWNIYNVSNGTSSLPMNVSITEQLRAARGADLNSGQRDKRDLFKIVFELVLDLHWLGSGAGSGSEGQQPSAEIGRHLEAGRFRISLLNVSVSDRCHPNQCEHGACQQNGTGLEDWNCLCEDRYRGRRCEFGHWCNVAHVTPWTYPGASGGGGQKNGWPITLRVPHHNAISSSRQPKLAIGDSPTRVTGEQYCKSKLGPGFKCTDIDLTLNDNLYTDEDKTFYCTCKDDFYLSDDSKCRQTHACNSIVCPSIGMVCDETKALNLTQPCHCNEKQDWFPDPDDPQNRCIRGQCHDRRRDCGFDAHLCIPTLPGERPICKCAPKFALKVDDKGKKYCQSTACVLPTLNDCQQICLPDNGNISKPYTCSCHAGYQLDENGRTCSRSMGARAPHCKPTCPSDSQICTDHGCRCKQGFLGEGEQKVRRLAKGVKGSANSSVSSSIEYTESVRCLNVCSLSYAENKEEFEMIESVCPLGLCDPNTFQCKCSDPSSVSLANDKYEPIYANCSSGRPGSEENKKEEDTEEAGEQDEPDRGIVPLRVSPLCHLRRVCTPESSSFRVCQAQGAICVPDYTKAAKFDCVCPPSTEKRFYGQGTVAEFTCESKCSSKKSDCLRKQAVCKQIDRDLVRCDCLPGFMLQDNFCYLARYSYSMSLMVVNKYYEPEVRFHRLIEHNSTIAMGASGLCPRKSSPESQDLVTQNPGDQQDDREKLSEIVPQFNKLEARTLLAKASTSTKPTKSIFIIDYNQCNITQVLPRSFIEDPYEHDIESYLGYIEQCNEKVHQNMKNYHLNSRLGEDIRQSLRQHLREFTITTSNSSCIETDSSGMILNCTIYIQSNEPIEESTIDFVFNNCEKNAHNDRYCWIKPRLLLLRKQQQSNTDQVAINDRQQFDNKTESQARDVSRFNFKQIVPCEIDNFCGLDAISHRIDDKMSLCSCKCPTDVEVIDVKDLEPRRPDDDPSRVSVREICAPRNHCGTNSTHCLLKPSSVCQYDVRTGSRCVCVHPSYEDSSGKCVEVTPSQLDNSLIMIIIILAAALLISVFLNILVAARTRSMFGRSKQYPLHEYSAPSSRPMNRSTGVPNPVFEND